MTPSVLWITGARGLIGSYLLRQAAFLWPQCRVIPVARPETDLTHFAEVARRFKEEKPEAVIHAAAMSRSPACQANPSLAHLHNVEVTRHLADLCSEIPLVFFSSDLVFDGKTAPYSEDATPNPVMVYGENKAEAEHVVRQNSRHLILRTSINCGHSTVGNRSFNEEMVLAWRSGKTLQLFTDEFRCPIPALETSRVVLELLQRNFTGIVHIAGPDRLSRWEIGQLLAARHPEIQPRMEPASLSQYTGSPRPADVSLDCTRIQKLLGRPLAGFRDWVNSDSVWRKT